MTKRKADCTPEEWSAHLEYMRGVNRASHEKHRSKRLRQRSEVNKDRWKNDPAYRAKRLAKAKAHKRSPEALQRKKETDENSRLQRVYGVDLTFVRTLEAVQDGKCAVCSVRFSEKKKSGRHIDHCHESNKVRGLLCNTCNILEGLLRKLKISPSEYADRLQRYLNNPPASGADLV